MSKNYEFTRYGSSPILVRGAGGSDWDRGDIAAPYVFLDSANSRWVMGYSGYDPTLTADSGFTLGTWAFGLAYATYNASATYGGLEGTWTKEAANPVMSSAYAKEGYISANGAIDTRVESGTRYYYHIYHGANTPPASAPSIFIARSTDLVTWTRLNSGDPVIAADAIDPQFGFTSDGYFECYYLDGNINRHMVRAISQDGISWLTKTIGYRMPFTSANFGELNPVAVTSELRVSYDMADTESPERMLGDYLSSDQAATFSARRKRLAKASGGADWDRGQVFDSCSIVFGTKIIMFYAGAVGGSYTEGMGSDIGMAVADYEQGVF